MSTKHPVIAVTGSSGAGTTTVTNTFMQIFRREQIEAAIVHGDSFHKYDRAGMKQALAEAEAAGNFNLSHFGPEANNFEDLEELFRQYGQDGTGRIRDYIHDAEEAEFYGQPPGTFTPEHDIPEGSDLLMYEGLHGAVKTDTVDVGQYADLRIGVVPIINLEWIQKLHRDREERGYSTEAITDTILRRMHDYVYYVTPQFSRTHINFQRVPVVDTSNPFIAKEIPTADESLTVIRFSDPTGIDFPYLLSMIHDSYMSRSNSIVVPGGKLPLAMRLVLTPMIGRLMDRSRKELSRG